MGETLKIGGFQIRVESVTVEDRRHQDAGLHVEVRLGCDGGNRFDRMDLADALGKKGKAYFRAESGWRERLYFVASGDDARTLVAFTDPPRGSQGYSLSLGNPFGKPDRYEVDLGR